MMKITLFAPVLMMLGLQSSCLWSQTAEISFGREIVDPNPPQRPWYKMVGDLDGDGEPDLVVGGAKGPLVCYQGPAWKKTQIAEGGWDGVRGAIDDLDRDGDADIVMGGIVWLENPGALDGHWNAHRVDRLRAHDVQLADLDRDGWLDIVARDQSAFGKAGDWVAVYRQTRPGEWKKQVLSCPHGEGIKVADVDADGDSDILIPGRWFENIGGDQIDLWPQHVFSEKWNEPDAKVETADLNGDGRLDVVLTPAELAGEFYRIAWFEAPPDPRSAHWTEHVIAERVESVMHSLDVADFDEDGSVDVATAAMHQGADPDEVMVLLNRDRGRSWQKLVISQQGSHDIIAADVDRDGDVDIVGANHAGADQAVVLWRNQKNER